MKIAYISPPYFSDVDLSYLPEAVKYHEIDYIIPLSVAVSKGGAIYVDDIKGNTGICSSDTYPELSALFEKTGLNPGHVYFANNYGKTWHSFKTIKYALSLFRFLRKNKYDLIHLTEFPRLSELILLLFRNKTVITVHDPIPHSSEKSRQIRFARKLAFRVLKNFIVLNSNQKEEFVKVNRLECKRVFESHLSVYSYKRMYDRKPQLSYPYVLFFGQITSHKGVDVLLEAFKTVKTQHTDVKLVIAGKWKWNYDYSSYLTDQDFVFMDKFIPDDDLSSLIQGSLFVVVPYLDATQSGVVMSSFAFGKPCIATNVGGLPEMVEDGKRGIIVEPANPDALSDAISYLLDNPQKYTQFSDNIRSYYEKGPMSWEYIAKSLSEVYNEIAMRKN